MTGLPDALPLLAVGSHPRGSGKACIMNAISYINGDAQITDLPACSDAVLASLAQQVNDNICLHRVREVPKVPATLSAILCAECSRVMWGFGLRLIGTAGCVPPATDPRCWRGWVRVAHAVMEARLREVSSAARCPDMLALFDLMEQGLAALAGWAYGDTLLRPPSHLSIGGKKVSIHPWGSIAVRWREALEQARLMILNRVHVNPAALVREGELSTLSALDAAWRMVGRATDGWESVQTLARVYGPGHPRVLPSVLSAISPVMSAQRGSSVGKAFGLLLDVWEREFRPDAPRYNLTAQRVAAVQAEINGREVPA